MLPTLRGCTSTMPSVAGSALVVDTAVKEYQQVSTDVLTVFDPVAALPGVGDIASAPRRGNGRRRFWRSFENCDPQRPSLCGNAMLHHRSVGFQGLGGLGDGGQFALHWGE